MKRTTALILACLLLAGCSGRTETAVTPAPTAEPTTEATAVPAQETPVPTETPEPDVRVRVSFETDTETVTENGVKLLDITLTRPVVTIPGNAAAAARIIAAIDESYTAFTEGIGVTDTLSGREGFLAAAREELADRGEESFMPYSLSRSVEVTRCDDRVLSLVFSDYSYSGGVHGNAAVGALNIDVRTGSVLSLDDLTDDADTFRTECADLLWTESRTGEHLRNALGGYYDGYEDTLPTLLREGNWYFDGEGLVILANPYEIAPYASGVLRFTLGYSRIRWLARENYLPVQSEAAGELRGEFSDGAADITVTEPDALGAMLFTALGDVENVELRRVNYLNYLGSYAEAEQLFFAGSMADGETLRFETTVPGTLPNTLLRYSLGNGEVREYLLAVSGYDGSLVLMDYESFARLPVEISGKLPYARDVDGDGAEEIIDLVRATPDARAVLTVDGVAAADVLVLDAEPRSLWLCDLDYDGVTEILLSGDLGSDDYVTCAWRGDTLALVPFTGENRRGADATAKTDYCDGSVVFSQDSLYLVSVSAQLGTYAAARVYKYADGVIAPESYADWGYDIWSYPVNREFITLTAEVPVSLRDDAFSISDGVLSPGTRIRLTGGNADTVFFVTQDGREGCFAVEWRGGDYAGWFVNGVPESETFESLPYAG